MLRTMIPALQKRTSAFTRLELVTCMAAVTLLITIIVPALANTGARSDRVVCFSNLRQIGVAYGQFGLEHDDRAPWRVSSSEGGNMDHPFKPNIDVQISAVSNGLATPKVLSDPGDRRAGHRPANNWGTGAGGLLNPAFGKNGISYFLAIDGFPLPRSILAGDHNLPAQGGQGCSSGVVPAYRLITPTWTNSIHGLAGNIVFFDGSATQVDSGELSDVVGVRDDVGEVSGVGHLLLP